jgi:hypothetical protein
VERDCCLSTKLEGVAIQKTETLQLTQTQYHPLFSVNEIKRRKCTDVYFPVPEYAFIVIAADFRNKTLLKHSILRSYTNYKAKMFIYIYIYIYDSFVYFIQNTTNHAKTNEEKLFHLWFLLK